MGVWDLGCLPIFACLVLFGFETLGCLEILGLVVFYLMFGIGCCFLLNCCFIDHTWLFEDMFYNFCLFEIMK